jgi:leucyl aminopeptidase
MPFEALFNDANPKIHTANDTLAFMGNSMDNSVKFGKMAAAFVAELAKGSSVTNPTDTTPPTVAVTAPAANAQVSGIVTVSADASDNVAVAKVEFLIDGNVANSDTSAPYLFDWNTETAGNGSHGLVAVAYDSSQNVARTSGTPVTVSNQSEGTLQAAYDATRRAPTCAGNGSGCDSGNLLTGRGTVGPEGNAPNTVNSSCADGLSGTFHRDESVDGLKVTTLDGKPMRSGVTVKIEALVWAYSSFSSDSLDLYAADDIASLNWRFIGTLSPTAAGAQTLSTTYTLGAGPVQAIRARIRYRGTASSCGNGSYDDVDDLVFAVQP